MNKKIELAAAAVDHRPNVMGRATNRRSPGTARVALLLLSLFLISCGKPAAKVVKVVPPAGVIQKHVEPLTLPVSGEILQTVAKDAVDVIVAEAELQFARGEDLYRQGFLKRAKDEFDGATDLLLESSETYPNDSRLQRELSNLVTRVHTLEMAALREGDGFTDQTGDHAAIDDLKHVETFPALMNPTLKKEVEDELTGIIHDLPIEINDRVLGFLEYYSTGRGRATIEVGLERVGRYQPMIEQILKEEAVPLDLIYLAQAESAFLPRALSRAKAKGMWQFIPSRGKEYGLRQTWWIDERSDPDKSTRAAARHLKDLYEEFGDWYLAMAAYNSGPGRVQRALLKTKADNFWTLAEKRALPKETINYIPNILALTIIGKNPEKYGFNVAPAPALETERVHVDQATDLRIIAEAIDLPLDELRALNAHVLRWATPPEDPDFQLILPKGYSEKFVEQVASLPPSKRVLFREHVVRKGDTLGVIAKKYGATTSDLAQANSLGKKPAIRIGQTLIIPMSGVDPTLAASASAPVTAPAKTKASSYTVRAGDTLSRIASLFNTTVARLKSLNQLSSNQIVVGKKLLVGAQDSN